METSSKLVSKSSTTDTLDVLSTLKIDPDDLCEIQGLDDYEDYKDLLKYEQFDSPVEYNADDDDEDDDDCGFGVEELRNLLSSGYSAKLVSPFDKSWAQQGGRVSREHDSDVEILDHDSDVKILDSHREVVAKEVVYDSPGQDHGDEVRPRWQWKRVAGRFEFVDHSNPVVRAGSVSVLRSKNGLVVRAGNASKGGAENAPEAGVGNGRAVRSKRLPSEIFRDEYVWGDSVKKGIRKLNSSTVTEKTPVSPGRTPGKSYRVVVKCAECSARFQSADLLQKHLALGPRCRLVYCDACGQSFVYAAHLDVHRAACHTEVTFLPCSHCDSLFATRVRLGKHEATHGFNRPYPCPVCGKGFSSQSRLNRHLLVHRTVMPIRCSVCFKGFRLAHNFREHAMLHIKSPPFSCDLCGRGFGYKNNLKAHLLTHTGMTFKCPLCFKNFEDHRSLKRHPCSPLLQTPKRSENIYSISN